jgi:3-phosphoshikimate 1-carboxyvinyltransferase
MSSSNPPYPYYDGITYNSAFFTAESSSGLSETQANALYLRKTITDTATALETFNGITNYGTITIADWPHSTTQPGDQLRQILTDMGAKVEFVDGGARFTGGAAIHGIDIDLHDVGELTPAIAALAALADSPSHLRGIGHLRLHETDRLLALRTELNSLGGDVIDEEDSLHINPQALHTGIFHTYEDHRLATAGAVIGLVVEGIQVENIATTRKTLTDFPALWSSALKGNR